MTYGSTVASRKACTNGRGGPQCQVQTVSRFRMNRNLLPSGFGMGLGLLLRPKEITVRADGVIILTGTGWPSTTTFGNVIVSNRSSLDQKTLAHELRHVTQWADMGSVAFLASWTWGEVYFSVRAEARAMHFGPRLFQSD